MESLENSVEETLKRKKYHSDFESGQRTFYIQIIFTLMGLLEFSGNRGLSKTTLAHLDTFVANTKRSPLSEENPGFVQGLEFELQVLQQKIDEFHDQGLIRPEKSQDQQSE